MILKIDLAAVFPGLVPSAETRAPKTKNERAKIGIKGFFRPNLTLPTLTFSALW